MTVAAIVVIATIFFALVHRSIRVCCTDLHSFHLTWVFTIILNIKCCFFSFCFVFCFIPTNMIDTLRYLSPSLKKIYIFITLFEEKEEKATATEFHSAHHQFVINIHPLVSAVPCLWYASSERTHPHPLNFFIVISVKVNFHVHIYTHIISGVRYGWAWCCCCYFLFI